MGDTSLLAAHMRPTESPTASKNSGHNFLTPVRPEKLEISLTNISPQALASALSDLPQGGRHALRSCLLEWEGGRLSSQHLIAFVRSIAWQSPSLAHLRPNRADADAACWDGGSSEKGSPMCELLSAEDMQVSHARAVMTRS